MIFNEDDMNKESLNRFFEEINDFLLNILILSKELNENKSRILEVREKERVQFQEYYNKFKNDKYQFQ